MRLDVYLTENRLAKSREQAKELIKSGCVFVGNSLITKPAYDCVYNDVVEIRGELPKYVGRGGLKLEKAISEFGIELCGKVCIDIGASTGGFTDCMLKNGAAFVYAADVGHGQLDESLINDSRVLNMEGRNIRDMAAEDFPLSVSFISADVSFVSLRLIIPKISELLPSDGAAVVLIKPQFEAGRQSVGKNGIVKDPKTHIKVLTDIIAACLSEKLPVQGLTYSSITGGSGNIEYLAYLKKGGEYLSFDVKKIVSEAFGVLK